MVDELVRCLLLVRHMHVDNMTSRVYRLVGVVAVIAHAGCGANEPANELMVAEGESMTIVAGEHSYDRVTVNGTLRLEGHVTISADKLAVGASGLVDGSDLLHYGSDHPSAACPDEISVGPCPCVDPETCGGQDIRILASEVAIAGTITVGGNDRSAIEQSEDAGSIVIETDTLELDGGALLANGGTRDFISEFSSEVPGGDGGRISLTYRASVLAVGRVAANGGDGDNACEFSGSNCLDIEVHPAGNGGDGGTISVDPAGDFPGLVVEVAGGAGGAGLGPLPPGTDGADGSVVGVD